jgi:integrase
MEAGSVGAFQPTEFAPIKLQELTRKFLAWLATENNSAKTSERRRLNLQRFLRFMGNIDVQTLDIQDLEKFRAQFKGTLHRRHHEVSVKALLRWGRNHKYLAPVDPFLGLQPTRQPVNALSEHDLPTEEEINLLLANSDADITPICVKQRFRRRKPDEYREDHPWKGFRDLLTLYLETGARTAELLNSRIRDYQPRSKTLVLNAHKTAGSTGKPRTIVLSPRAIEILDRHVVEKNSDSPIFLRPNGERWTVKAVNIHLRAIRERAGIKKYFTMYIFRDLWISDGLLAGVPIATIAKMAGTSSAMIEKH